MPLAQALPGDVGADQRGVDVHHVAFGDPGLGTGPHRTGEDPAEQLRAPALPNSRQAGVVRERLVQPVAGEPAYGDVDPGFAQQPPVVDDAEQEAGEHEADRRLRVDAGPAGAVRSIAAAHFGAEPTQLQHAVDAGQDVIVRNEVAQGARHQQLGLTSHLAAQHRRSARAVAPASESELADFFNSPTGHPLQRRTYGLTSLRPPKTQKRRAMHQGTRCP